MREQKTYICDYCGNGHPTKAKAAVCEEACLEKLNQKTEVQRAKEKLEQEEKQFIALHFAKSASVFEILSSIEQYFAKFTNVNVQFDNKYSLPTVDSFENTASSWAYRISFKSAETGKDVYNYSGYKQSTKSIDAKFVLKSVFGIDAKNVAIQLSNYPTLFAAFQEEIKNVEEVQQVLKEARVKIRKKISENEELNELKKKFIELDEKLVELYKEREKLTNHLAPAIVREINEEGANEVKDKVKEIKSRGGPFGKLKQEHVESVYGYVNFESNFDDQMRSEFESSEC